MTRRALLPVVLALVLAAGCGGGGGGGGGGPSGLDVTTEAFDDGAAIPERYSCEGENVPPVLRWGEVPAGTAEVAVVVDDPDAPEGTFVHWIVTGIPPQVRSIGGAAPLPAGAREHPGSSDLAGYIGPCPPSGGGRHRYRFDVYALRRAVDLPDALAPAERARRIREAASAGGRVVGTFTR